MKKLDDKIVSFIKKMNLLTFCVSENDLPYCASSFYVFDEKRSKIIILASSTSKHIQIAQRNPNVAINIALDTKIIAQIQGAQIQAKFSKGDENHKKLYLEKFPIAKMLIFETFVLDIKWVKYVDNSLGFGTKLVNDLR